MTAQRAASDTAPVVPLADLTALTDDVAVELDLVWRHVTKTSFFIGGKLVGRFEDQWANYCDTHHAVGVANGTDAIELTLRALGIGPGDEVIVPANTFIATPEAVVLAGATPRFVDVDPETLLMTAETISPAVNERTAAVIVVHLYGNMPNMADIVRLTEAKQLALVEDAAQAHGSTWRGTKAGSFGVAGCFSFYPGKNLGAFGDAGAVVTDDSALADEIRSLGNHGRPAHSNHVHAMVARNSRLDALQAAVLSVKLTMLDTWNDARRHAMATYRSLLDPDRVPMVKLDAGAESTHHQNVVHVSHRDAVRAALRRSGIETGVHYPIPCHQQEPYKTFATDPLPVVERAAADILSLPVFPHISEDQINHVCTRLKGVTDEIHEHVA